MKPFEIFSRTPKKEINIFSFEDAAYKFSSNTSEEHNVDKFYDAFSLAAIEGFYFPELGYEVHDVIGFGNSDRVIAKVYEDCEVEFDRGWKVVGIFLDNKPVLLMQTAGRGYSDYVRRFIVDADRYDEMVKLIKSLAIYAPCEYKHDVIGMDEFHHEIGNFYGEHIDNIKG